MKKIYFAIIGGCLILMLSACRSHAPNEMETMVQETEDTEAFVAQEEEVIPEPVPVFTTGIPYLFPDELGFLHPDEILSDEEIQQAMDLLLPEDGDENRRIFVEQKREELQNSLSQETTKRDFAGLVYAMILAEQKKFEDYTAEELLVICMDNPEIPRDMDMQDDALLMAVTAYEISREGETFCEAILQCRWPSGNSLIDGYLFYADEKGKLARDIQVGCHLFFDEWGRFTSGNAELDGLTRGWVLSFVEEEPTLSRYELLQKSFDLCVYNYVYDPVVCPDYGDNCNDEWYIPMAIKGLDLLKGNCYGFASGFCAMARQLGYDAHCLSAWALAEPDGPHSWVQIDMLPEGDRSDDFVMYSMLKKREQDSGEEISMTALNKALAADVPEGMDLEPRFFDPELRYLEVVLHIRSNYGIDMFDFKTSIGESWAYHNKDVRKTCYGEGEFRHTTLPIRILSAVTYVQETF